MVNRRVEFCPKSKMSDIGREIVHFYVERISKSEVRKARGRVGKG